MRGDLLLDFTDRPTILIARWAIGGNGLLEFGLMTLYHDCPRTVTVHGQDHLGNQRSFTLRVPTVLNGHANFANNNIKIEGEIDIPPRPEGARIP